MALLPTGSDKLLEISTEEVNIVIKSKKKWKDNDFPESSSVVVEGYGISSLFLKPNADKLVYEKNEHLRIVQATKPLFFEQTDYELVISSTKGKRISFFNENHSIQESVGIVRDGDDTLLSGVINFGNTVGYTDFVFFSDVQKVLSLRIEVFPSKISYKDDYNLMIEDISEMVCEVALDFMRKTYRTFGSGATNSSLLSVYFQILSAIFKDFLNAVNRITAAPNHKLVTEHSIVPEHKAKRIDRVSEKWIVKHSDQILADANGISLEYVLSAKKRVTYDTNENRFVKFVLRSTVKKLEQFKRRYIDSAKQAEKHIISEADNMIREVRRALNLSFLNEVAEYSGEQSMSLVFGMAPGYRELYKYYVILQKSLSVNGDVFKMSPKDTAQLYEYWCFIKLFSMLKKEYDLKTPDIIKIDNNGITVTLVKGEKSEARFVNPDTEEVITLTYNPGETKTQTVNQKPDNVLELEKAGTSIRYKYVFDAKYRIEQQPDGIYYPDVNPGPKVDDINTMHRYRDSIVYENPQSRYIFEKTMFGAYILFPYDEEEKYSTYEHLENGKKVCGHKFYRSIESVNIGGLPFLPGATKLVQKLLAELINDSKESAFERSSLPIGIEEKLAKVDWSRRDVLIGTFRSTQQYDKCFEGKFYYVPEKRVGRNRLPIHYVALYQTNSKFDNNGEIRYFGEVIGFSRVKRKSITEVPMTRNNPEEIYYRISVKSWEDITKINETGKPIYPKESGFVVDFTNMFLLEHSEIVPELQFRTEDEYRFYHELKRSANKAEISEGETNIGFDRGDCKFVFAGGEILAFKDDKIVERIQLTDFSRRPAQMFRLLQYATRINKTNNEQ
ncbi:restriction endonuclease-like protein [Butyrivibrio proteoclasticus]|uniref:restriction endonuclease-like protein n=1 Tax=Butyrivibrio proteoclasticus TaxID=43305 RepID=UPI000683E18C|nr:restriction endonuclease-like protein [Butyrivibrio proteoclasticus]